MRKQELRFWRIRWPLENDDTFLVITTKDEDIADALAYWKEWVVGLDEIDADFTDAARQVLGME